MRGFLLIGEPTRTEPWTGGPDGNPYRSWDWLSTCQSARQRPLSVASTRLIVVPPKISLAPRLRNGPGLYFRIASRAGPGSRTLSRDGQFLHAPCAVNPVGSSPAAGISLISGYRPVRPDEDFLRGTTSPESSACMAMS